MKTTFKVKGKAFFIVLKRLSIAKNYLRIVDTTVALDTNDGTTGCFLTTNATSIIVFINNLFTHFLILCISLFY